jgi:CheY-like chemotaxis protein
MNQEASPFSALDLNSNEFWSSVGHELRGPLSTILARVETLEQGVFGELNPSQVSALKPILQEVRALSGMVNDLVGVACEGAAQKPQTSAPCSPYAMGQRAFTELGTQLQRRSIQWIDDATSQSLVVLADAPKLERIITELIGLVARTASSRSQVRYTASYQAPSLVLKVQRLTSVQGSIQTAESKSHALDTNLLGSAMKTRPLGCMVLAQLVEAHEGTWIVHRSDDEATALSILLPLANQPGHPPVTEVLQEGHHEPCHEAELITARSINILLADDEPTLVSVTRHYLENLGHVVSVACDGLQAVEMALHLQPDLILMDVHMPAMNGLNAIRSIRNSGSEKMRTVPIVSLTGMTSLSDKARCIDAGANECLIKPFGIKDIDRILSAFTRPTKSPSSGESTDESHHC